MIIQHSSMPMSRVKIDHKAKAQRYTLEMERVIKGYTWLGFHVVEMVGHVNKKDLFITLERMNQIMEGDTLLYSTLETTQLWINPIGQIISRKNHLERIDLPDPEPEPAEPPVKPKRTRKAKAKI